MANSPTIPSIPLAHSPRSKTGVAAQPYVEHVMEVVLGALERARAVAMYSPKFGETLVAALRLASEFHDLGKLDDANQKILCRDTKKRLDVKHEDAGVAHLFNSRPLRPDHQFAAILIYSHHRGLPSMLEEKARTRNAFRFVDLAPDGRVVRERTDERLSSYALTHIQCLGALVGIEVKDLNPKVTQLWFRIALSCLVDADHSDSARSSREAPSWDAPRPSWADRLSALETSPDQLRGIQSATSRWADRLASLDTYVAGLSKGKSDARTRLRGRLYDVCRSAETSDALRECDSPVGTGKTTAVMAHLLQAALAKNLRRIFVVLPFTNIIDQSVDIYRKCLVLPGENPESIVAAVHHKADYTDPDSRHLASLWEAPVVVTTAVQFFETLAASSTGGLRKLHSLPGSAVFIDESHAALPAKLWPRAWNWIEQLADDWGCHFVLGSGSLSRIWTLDKVESSRNTLPLLVSDPAVKAEADEAERRRLRPQSKENLLTIDEFVEWLGDRETLPGPRLVIVNTVQIAAAVAKRLAERDGLERVMHLSTALTPHHRAITLERVKSRLQYCTDDDWTLVATSCVEAGVDFSFRTGLRQRASLASLLQIAGRVNRNLEFDNASLWDFDLVPGGLINKNPVYEDSAEILKQLFQEGKVEPEFCTEALSREIVQTRKKSLFKELDQAESSRDFPKVEKLFRIIDSETLTAVISQDIQKRLNKGSPIDWREVQKHSVQIYKNRVDAFRLLEAPGRSDVYLWNLPYDEFLGYMTGVLPLLQGNIDGGFIA